MNKFNISFSIIFIWPILSLPAQNPYYTIESFQDEYVELETYTSLHLETLGDRTWEKTFELDFEFPFFDRSYTSITCDSEATCIFEDALDYNLYLFNFGYKLDGATDSNNITSDLRYTQLEKDGVKALVLQFTKNRLRTDPSIEEHDSHVNFQAWMFENGDVEIRFGDMNLEHSPNYVPGEGFYFIFESGSYLSGPYVFIRHPDSSETPGFGIRGVPHEEYEVYNDSAGSKAITIIPPKGWVIRFSKKAVSNTKSYLQQEFKVSPNPANSIVNIVTEKPVDKVFIYSRDGRLVLEQDAGNQLNIESLPQGMYYMNIISEGYAINKKLIKY